MKHLVDVHVDRCIGCTRCMRACPTEAIRIINKKVHLLQDRCIYCGNCILSCHKNAYKVKSDSFANLTRHKLNVVIFPLAIYGMMSSQKQINGMIQTLKDYGFDEVFDLSPISEILVEKIQDFVGKNKNTYILSQCPSVIRLLQLKYPSLLPYLLPFDFPFEIGAKYARKMMSEKYDVSPSEIGISYISECLSNFIAIKEPLGKKTSEIDHVFLFSDLFRDQLASKEPNVNVSRRGIQTCMPRLFDEMSDVLIVDGIKEVDEVLEKIDLNPLPGVRLIGAYSCKGGCIGGNFTVEDPFISQWRIKNLCEKISLNASDEYVGKYRNVLKEDEWFIEDKLDSLSPFKLGQNINQSMIKMMKINEILHQLPNIDCCACGSPSCRALAEDIVNGEKTIKDCYLINSKGE